jgi:uncharacterized protein YdaU (DUF1376 family)
MKPPAFQFYADDFLGGTVDLGAEDVGAYIRLLCYQWGRGSIPSSIEVINRVAGCEVSREVLAKFPEGKNRRMEAERAKQSEYRDKQAKNASKRWVGNANAYANAYANAMPNGCSPSPSPSPSPVSVTVSSKGGVPLEPSTPLAGDKPAPVKRFVKPSAEEVGLQCAKIGLPDAEGAKFLSYYESNGWRVGRNPMRSWPHALQNWKINHDSNHARNGRPSTLSPSAARNANIAGHEQWKRDADAADAAAALAGNQEAPW